MRDYFKIAEVSIGITHRNDALYRSILPELEIYRRRRPGRCDVSVEFRPAASLPALPKRAVLDKTTSWYVRDSTYNLGDSVYHLAFGSALVRKDFGHGRMEVVYREHNKLVRLIARTSLKWVIIKAAEAKGHSFFHASAARYRGMNVVFVGGSGFGKTSCLFRLCSAGAEPICDDALLVRDGRLASFGFHMSVKGDFAERFHVAAGVDRMAWKASAHGDFKGVDLVLFPAVWNYPASEVAPIDRKEAMAELIRTYEEEMLWNARPLDREAAERRIRQAVRGARFFRFCAGTKESEVSKTLFGFLNRRAKKAVVR